MKYKIFLLLLVCIFTNETFSQSKNAVFVEIAGNTNLYSLNYERGITEKIKARIGFGYTKTDNKDFVIDYNKKEVFMMPVMLSYVLGGKKSKIEISSGMLFGWENDSNPNKTESVVNITLFAGYRYEAEKGFLLRIGMAPHYNIVGDPNYIIDTFYYWGGLSLGYHF